MSGRWGWIVALGLILAAACLAVPRALAHPLAPSLVRLEVEAGGFHVTIRSPRAGRAPVLRTGCVRVALADAMGAELRVVTEAWRCMPEAELRLVAASGAPPVIVERVAPGAEPTLSLLDAAHPMTALGARHVGDGGEGVPVTAADWLALGVGHLLGGPDHLLIIAALVALVGLRRRLVGVLTAFTLGHSLSLALGATGVVPLPAAVVEVAIALTLVAVGLELAAPVGPSGTKDGPARAGLVPRRPCLGGLAIGLVHGLGFAGAMAELLPDARFERLAPAVVAFNGGLELAQLGLVAVLAAAIWAARRVVRVPAGLAPRATGWVVGMAGAAWVVDRMLG